MGDNNSNGEYETGYGKPPKHTRFRKGRSGNPKGRPRGSKNMRTLLNDALDERVVINEGGRKKTATKRQVIVKQMVNRAAQGEHRSIKLLMSYLEKHPQNENEDNRPALRDFLEVLGPIPDGLSIDAQMHMQAIEANRVAERAPALLPKPAATEHSERK